MAYFVDCVLKEIQNAEPTHLAICNGDKVRYYLDLSSRVKWKSRKRLCTNISTYSLKLRLCMAAMRCAPVCMLKMAHVGRVTHLTLDPEVQEMISQIGLQRWPGKETYFNVIVGSYVEKQKIVLQCFCDDDTLPAVYVKIGGENSHTEMENETDYLSNPILSSRFDNPVLCAAHFRRDGFSYNIQATEEISGVKVIPEMNDEIYQIFSEIASRHTCEAVDGTRLAFSHGDFVPWNIKKTNSGYVVFDWEYCGIRFYGFDLIHYLWQVENKLHKESPEGAIKKAMKQARDWDPYLASISGEKLEEMYFAELKKQFGEIL